MVFFELLFDSAFTKKFMEAGGCGKEFMAAGYKCQRAVEEDGGGGSGSRHDVEACVKATAALRRCMAANEIFFKHHYIRALDVGIKDNEKRGYGVEFEEDEEKRMRWRCKRQSNLIVSKYQHQLGKKMLQAAGTGCGGSPRGVLLRAQVIVDEAMGRQITNQAMLQQLDMLRDAMHQGCYTLDTFSRNTEILEQMQKVLDNLSSMILDVEEMVIFLNSYRRLYRQPYSMHILLNNCMFGRQMEAEFIIKFLLHTQHQNSKELEVLPIVGPGKVGKSTLVAHVCKDERVRDHFSETLWLRDHDFTIDGLATFREGCALKHQDRVTDLNNDRRLLVIVELIGDINEDVWNKFCYASKQCLPVGSKIIVTSRSENAVRFGTTRVLTLKYLPQEAYWYFFKTLTFGSTDPKVHPRHVHQAMEIAKILNGSFNSANITAGFLRDNFDIHFWCKVLAFLRAIIQRHVSRFGGHPSAILNGNRPACLRRMGGTSEDFVIYDGRECLSQEEVPKIRQHDVIFGSVKPHGKFEALAWRSQIPPYYSYVNTYEGLFTIDLKSLWVTKIDDYFNLDGNMKILWMVTIRSGSKIIVTSQSDKIVKFGTTHALTLNYLSHEAYWYFFKTITVGSMDPERHPRLTHLAMEIATMLNGSLIGANVTSHFLRDNFDVDFWQKILSFLRGSFQEHVSKCDEHPLDLLKKNRCAHFRRMAMPSEEFVVYHQYQRSSQDEVAEIRVQDVMYGSVKPRGIFEFLRKCTAVFEGARPNVQAILRLVEEECHLCKYSKPLALDVQYRLCRILARAQVIIDEAMGRHITNRAMIQQLDMLRDAMFQGYYYTLDRFRYQCEDTEEAKDQTIETEHVANFLLHTQTHCDKELEVLPIVGPGRVGKGTLVAHVCNDERIRDHFSEIVFLRDHDFRDEK
ncbi:hypothetical protein BAE44_0025604, partial [Dichanthelium oligosanthes]